MNWEIAAFILYFIVVLGIGIYYFFKTKSSGNDESEYFLGGRQMGPWVTAMSAQASDMSAWLLMGLPGSVLALGMGQIWLGIGLLLGTSANWIFIATRLRRFSKAADDSITIPQYLQNRFHSKNHVLSVLSAIVILVAFTLYVASGYVAGAKVFTTLIPSLNPHLAMIIFAAIILLYTFLGGYKAVCLTDFFQGMLMLCAVIAVPIIAAITTDLDTSALSAVYTNATEHATYAFTSNPFHTTWQEAVSGLAWGLGYCGMPHILVRFMGIEKPSMIKKSATVAIIWCAISLAGVIAIAYLGRMIMGEQLLSTGKQELVFVYMVRKYFPAFLSGILLSAIIAASMSTADSQLLVASSSFTEDIYKPLIHKNASEKELLWLGRAAVVVVSVVAYFIASAKGSGAAAVMNIVENAWGVFGASFGPIMFLSLYWKRFNEQGAIAGLIAGAVSDVLWYNFLSERTGVYELLPAFFFAMLVAVIVTLLTKEPDDHVKEIFETATAKDNDD